MFGEECAREKLIVLVFVKPRALDVEQLQARHADREGKCVDRELRDGLVRARIRLVVEDVHGVVAHLQKVEVAGDAARIGFGARRKLDPVFRFKAGDFCLGEPDRDFDSDRA